MSQFMNIKCPNCNSFKTKKNRSIFFYLLFILFVFCSLGIYWTETSKGIFGRPFQNVAVSILCYLLPMIIYDFRKIKYICKSCGFKFTHKKDEQIN